MANDLHNIKLKQPKEFNAQKLANKKVMGVRVLKASQRADVIKGGEDVKTARTEIKGAQGDIDDAADEVDRGLDEQDKVESQAEEAQNSSSQGMSAEELDAETELLGQSSVLAQAKTQEFTEIGETLEEDFEAFTEDSETKIEDMNNSLEEYDGISEEIVALSEEAEALNAEIEANAGGSASAPAGTPAGAPASAPAKQFTPSSDGMGGVVDPASDGTGAGTRSAYSLTTGADAQPQSAPAMAPRKAPGKGGLITGTNPAPAAPTPTPVPQNAPAVPTPVAETPTTETPTTETPTDTTGGAGAPNNGGANTEYQTRSADLKSRMDDANARQEVVSDNITTTTTAVNEDVDARTEVVNTNNENANALVEEGNNQMSGLEKTSQILTQANQYGQYIKLAGTATKTVGAGLMGTGLAMNASGGTISGLGAAISGIGAALTSIGAPLCAVFGIGVPITAAGGATAGAGASTTSGGAALTGAGSGIYSAGQTAHTIGEATEKVGTGVTLAATAGLTGVAAAQGDWKGALTSGLSVATSAMSFAEGLGVLKGATEGVVKGFETTSKVLNAASATFNTTMAAIDGNVNGMISGSFSMLSAGSSFGNGKTANILGSSASFANSSFGLYQAIDAGDGLGIVQNSLGVMNSGANLLENAGVDTSLGLTAYEGTKYEYELDENGNIKTAPDGTPIVKTDENNKPIKHKVVRGSGSGSAGATDNGSKPNDGTEQNSDLNGNNSNASWKADTSKSDKVKLSDVTGWTSGLWSEGNNLVNTYNTIAGNNNDGSGDAGEETPTDTTGTTEETPQNKKKKPTDYNNLFRNTSNRYRGTRGAN